MNYKLLTLALLFALGCSGPREASINELLKSNQGTITRQVTPRENGIELIKYYAGTQLIGTARISKKYGVIKSNFIIDIPSLGSLSGVYVEKAADDKIMEVSISKLHVGLFCSVSTNERTITFFPARGDERLTITTDSAGTPLFPAPQK